MKVHSQPSRIIPASCRSRFVASAPAVCCAKTICSGMVGTHAVTISIVPKMLYSASGNFFGEQMHAQRHHARDDVGNHQPAALAEKRRVRLVVNGRNVSVCRTSRAKIAG